MHGEAGRLLVKWMTGLHLERADLKSVPQRFTRASAQHATQGSR
ncbi:hypothetical protein BOO71_0015109 [Deinococcus marmoris]|uniref:Uncharacterized protein n=1 Tax=Deinococcus marmoris TaxID=249408 RepID=A0A1U7NR06_9DEIO|nr:hypothetical protein BOO71_0015109 [Deinococcus marmoris]